MEMATATTETVPNRIILFPSTRVRTLARRHDTDKKAVRASFQRRGCQIIAHSRRNRRGYGTVPDLDSADLAEGRIAREEGVGHVGVLRRKQRASGIDEPPSGARVASAIIDEPGLQLG